MSRSFSHFIPLAALAIPLLAACTQAPAQVDYKGQATYSRNASNGYASNYAGGRPYGGGSVYQPAQVYANTPPVQSVPTSSIGVSDVVPPPAPIVSSDVPNPPFKTASPAPAPAAPAVTTQAAAPVNAWTQQSRFSDAPVPAKPAPQPVAALDQVVGNDGEAKVAAAAPAPAPAAKAETSFLWPVSGKKIISGFGPKGDGKSNDGINIAAGEGEPVWASATGEVVYVGNKLPDYGNMVLIKHKGGKTTAYAHLSRISVDKYSRVKQGDIIGYVGSTGGVKEPQLHFAIRDSNKQPLDPGKFLN